MFKVIVVILLMLMALVIGFLIGAVFVLEQLGENHEIKEDLEKM